MIVSVRQASRDMGKECLLKEECWSGGLFHGTHAQCLEIVARWWLSSAGAGVHAPRGHAACIARVDTLEQGARAFREVVLLERVDDCRGQWWQMSPAPTGPNPHALRPEGGLTRDSMRKSRTVHRGLANRSDHPRALMYIAFESDEGQHPSTFIRQKAGEGAGPAVCADGEKEDTARR